MATEPNILCIGVGRLKDKKLIAFVVNDKKSKDSEALKTLANQVIMSAKIEAKKVSLKCAPNMFHFSSDESGMLFFTITAESYPSRVAFQLLKDLEFDISALGAESASCEEDGLTKHCKKSIKVLEVKYQDPASQDKLTSIKKEVDTTTAIMSDNVKVLLSNTDKIEVIDDKAGVLFEQSAQFKDEATKLKNAMVWRNRKLYIIAAVFIVAIALYIVIPMIDKK